VQFAVAPLPSVSANSPAGNSGRKGLAVLLKGFALVLLAAVVFVLFDFAIDLRPSNIQASYRFDVGELAEDEVKILRHDNLSIVVIRRSAATIAMLEESSLALQDPESRDSRQPGYAENGLRSRDPRYFVSYGLGTDLGCTLDIDTQVLKEVCSNARYDFAGRALVGENRFPNLSIPDYTFSENFTRLTINP